MNLALLLYGLPGTGKTTICHHLLDKNDYAYLGVDDIWRDLFRNPTFSPAESELVFKEMMSRLERFLSQTSQALIIIEGVFASAKRINSVDDLCRRWDCTLHSILLTSEKSIALARVARRETNKMTPTGWHFLSRKTDSASLADLTLDTSNINSKAVAERIEQYIKTIYRF